MAAQTAKTRCRRNKIRNVAHLLDWAIWIRSPNLGVRTPLVKSSFPNYLGYSSVDADKAQRELNSVFAGVLAALQSPSCSADAATKA